MESVAGCFFFCKQKTAYDMRISDWSSDVCSSDLTARRPIPSAADIEPAAVEGVDVGLSEAARIARQRMLETGEREAGLGQRARVAARQMRVEHPRGEGVASADAVDDAGHVDLAGLVRSIPRVAARREAGGGSEEHTEA